MSWFTNNVMNIEGASVSGWMIAVVCLFLPGFALLSRVRWLGRMFFRGLAGVSGIFVIDFLLSPFHIAVGINLLTTLISMMLGLPGVGLMYILVFVLNR